MTLSTGAGLRFAALFKAGVAYRTALALAADADNFAAGVGGASGNLSLAPTQRGVFAPTTLYSLGQLAISPTGDIITPKVTFTSAAAYNAADWNVIVPAQNYGRELAGVESGANFTFATDSAYHDVTGMTMTIPAGIPYLISGFVQAGFTQGSAAAGAGSGITVRIVDSATSTAVFSFALDGFIFTGAGNTVWRPVSFNRRMPALAVATQVKMQCQIAALTGLSTCGLFPATFGGGGPTTMQAIGR